MLQAFLLSLGTAAFSRCHHTVFLLSMPVSKFLPCMRTRVMLA